MRRRKFSKSIKKYLNPAKSMICRIFLFIAIAVIFKNTPKVYGNCVAIFKLIENCHRKQTQKAVKTHLNNV